MSGIVIVYTLFGSADEAKAVARRIVEERLAACANIMAPCTSIYEWRGAMEEATETPVLFKTAGAQREGLMARIAQLHSYDTPAILSWDADAQPGYGAWVEAQVS